MKLTKTPKEVLNRFEEAVRSQEQYHSDVNQYGESLLDFTKVQVEYQEAKQELLTALGENHA